MDHVREHTPTDARFDLLVVGEINPDVVITDADPRPAFGQTERVVASISMTIGSSSMILAVGAARLGLRTSVVGKVGDDAFGRFMLDELQHRQLDVAHCIVDPTVPTGASVILSAPDDRAILSSLGATGTLRVPEIPEDLVGRARHLHVGSYYLQNAARPDLPAFFRRARERGVTGSVDGNWDPSGDWSSIQPVLHEIDVFLPNAEEAMRISGCTDPLTAARTLARTTASDSRPPLCVAVKLGAAGALAVRGDEEVHLPALPVDVVDTTGAGDSFGAGFLYGFLAGWSLRRSLALGIACGSLSTRLPGGTPAQPTLDEALAAMRDLSRLAPDR